MLNAGPTAGRLPWIDTARGAALVLVIAHHAVLFATAEGFGHPAWTVLNESLRLVRMPLFFVLSGLLTTGAVRRSWPDLLRGRIGANLWTYLVWATLAFVAFSLIPYAREPLPGGVAGWARVTVWLPLNGAWYLLALAVFTAATRAVRSVPARVLLPAAALLSAAVATGPLVRWSFVWNDMVMLFVFFLAGLRGRDVVLGLASRVPGWPAVLVVSAATALLAAGVTVTGLTSVPGVRLLVGVLAVAVGVAVSVRAAPSRPGRALARLGRVTLPVYVTHEVVLGCLVLALVPLAGWSGLPLVAVPVLVAAAVGVCLLLRRPLERVPGLLAPPWRTAPVTLVVGQRRRDAATPATTR